MKQEINIDIEDIMSEIRADIKARGLDLDDPSFDSIPICEADRAAAAGVSLAPLAAIAVYRPIVSRAGMLGKLIIFFKKLIRKCIVFILLPMASDQTRFNQAAAESVEQLSATVGQLQRQVDGLSTQVTTLTKAMELQKLQHKTEIRRLQKDRGQISSGDLVAPEVEDN